MKDKKRWGLLFAALLFMPLFVVDSFASRGLTLKFRTGGRTGAFMEEVQLYRKSKALVIGIDNYSQGWPKLSNAVKDATLVADELKNKGFEVTLKTNLDSSQLDRAFNEFFILEGEDPEARLFVWFAGHGHTEKGEGYLIPADAPTPEAGSRFLYKALSMRRFGEYVRKASSNHVFAVFDSCFSGTIFTTQRSKPPSAVTRATTLPVRQFLASGDANQEVSDNGMFRKLFIRALRGEETSDANGDGYLTASELGLFLTDRLTNLTESAQTPRYGKLRDPDYDRGDFVFLLASSGAWTDMPVRRPKGRATLSVKSNVPGAAVYVDGRPVGKTDLAGHEVAPGKHRVRVAMDGFETYAREMTVRPGRRVSLQAILDGVADPKGALYVETVPENAKVRILNIRPVFYQGIELDAGQYHLAVSKSGFATKKQWITLEAGEDKNIEVRLDEMAVPGSGERVTNSLGMEFVYIEPGTFMMGSPSGESGREDDEVQHRVTLTRGYYMQTTEVTQGQWQAVMGSRPWAGKDYVRENRNHPAVYVSWDDCQAFVRKLNDREGRGRYRLPTEAEWEYAARGGSASAYCFGDRAGSLGDYAWYDKNAWDVGEKYAHPAGRKKANRFGLYDMHGNVWEWCEDWYGDYPSGGVTDPKGASSGWGRVCRGGGWNFNASGCRSACRGSNYPSDRLYSLGFRLVRTP